jgi:hypothetical protein
VTFPLGQALYVDATHEVVVLYGAFCVFIEGSVKREAEARSPVEGDACSLV